MITLQPYEANIVTDGSGNLDSANPSGAGSGPTSTPNLFYDGFETGDLAAPDGPLPAINAGNVVSWAGVNATSLVTTDTACTVLAQDEGAVIFNGSPVCIGPIADRAYWTAKEGSNSMRFRYSTTNFWSEQRLSLTEGGGKTELWLRYWIQVPPNCVIANDIQKFLAVWTDGYSAFGFGSTAWLGLWPGDGDDGNLGFAYSPGDEQVAGGYQQEVPFISIPTDRGRWMQMVMQLKLESSDGADDGVIRTYRRWEDESSFTMLHEKTDAGLKAAPLPTVGFEHLYIMGYANTLYAENTEWLVDSFEMSTESLL